LENAPPQFRWRVSNTVNGVDKIFHEFFYVIGAAISQIALGQGPHPFIGIEFRRIGWEVFDAQTRVLAQQFLQRFPMVGAGVV